MRSDLSDIRKTIDVKLADLSETDIESLMMVLDEGRAAMKKKAAGGAMKVHGYDETPVVEMERVLRRARALLGHVDDSDDRPEAQPARR